MKVSSELHAPAALPQGKNSGIHFIGKKVIHRADVDVLVERTVS